jgi:hypothetical protein
MRQRQRSAPLSVLKVTCHTYRNTIGCLTPPQGATLKQIRDQTNVKVDIPPKDSFAPANESSSGKVTPSADEEDEQMVPITLTGSQPLVYEAQALLNQIIASKTSRSTQRVRDIPSHVLPFVLVRRPMFLDTAEGGDINLVLNAATREITVTGDREAVVRVVDVIRSTVDELKTSLTSLKMSLPKRQHRLLVGKGFEGIMTKSKCAVDVADYDDPSDEVIVWGQGTDLPAGLAAVMERANSQYIHEFPLPGPISASRQILTYMTHIHYVKTLTTAHPGVSVFFPSPTAIEKAQTLSIDLVGDKTAVDAVVKQLSELIGKLIGATRGVGVDWLVHRVIVGKNAKKYV